MTLTLIIAVAALFIGSSLGYLFLRRRVQTPGKQMDVLSRVLLESNADSVFVLDNQGEITVANTAARQFLPAANQEEQSYNFNDNFRLYDGAAQLIDVKRISQLANSTDNTIEVQNKSAQGVLTKFILKANALISPNQRTNTGFLVSLRDITHEKSIDQQRNEFISVVSHELRTPIAIVEGSISTILNDKLIPYTPTQRKMIKTAYDKVLYLADIVNNLNLVLQTENKTLDTTYKTVAPSDMMHRLLLLYQPIAKQKNISLSIDQVTNKQLLTDPQFLQEILTSFLSNAIEYTQSDGKVLLSSLEQRDGIVFRVSDNGPGISPTDQKMLFKKYFRTEDYHTKTTRGTGLSLYIAKQLADRLNGRVWCESLLGHGSRFYLFIPYVATQAQTEDRPEVIRAEVSEVFDQI